MDLALRSHHNETKAGRLRRRRPTRRYFDPIETLDDEENEIEIGGGSGDDKSQPKRAALP